MMDIVHTGRYRSAAYTMIKLMNVVQQVNNESQLNARSVDITEYTIRRNRRQHALAHIFKLLNINNFQNF